MGFSSKLRAPAWQCRHCRLLYPPLIWVGWRAHVLQINAGYTLELVLQRAVDGVVSVAGITGHVRRHAVVLKMLRRNVVRIVHVQTFSVVFHAVAGNAE